MSLIHLNYAETPPLNSGLVDKKPPSMSIPELKHFLSDTVRQSLHSSKSLTKSLKSPKKSMKNKTLKHRTSVLFDIDNKIKFFETRVNSFSEILDFYRQKINIEKSKTNPEFSFFYKLGKSELNELFHICDSIYKECERIYNDNRCNKIRIICKSLVVKQNVLNNLNKKFLLSNKNKNKTCKIHTIKGRVIPGSVPWSQVNDYLEYQSSNLEWLDFFHCINNFENKLKQQNISDKLLNVLEQNMGFWFYKGKVPNSSKVSNSSLSDKGFIKKNTNKELSPFMDIKDLENQIKDLEKKIKNIQDEKTETLFMSDGNTEQKAYIKALIGSLNKRETEIESELLVLERKKQKCIDKLKNIVN